MNSTRVRPLTRRYSAFAAAAMVALAMMFSGASQPAFAAADASNGGNAPALYKKKKCKKGSKKKSKKCKGKKGQNAKPWAGSGYRPGQVCSLSAEMQKKYKRYGLFCLDFGLGIWSLEPL